MKDTNESETLVEVTRIPFKLTKIPVNSERNYGNCNWNFLGSFIPHLKSDLNGMSVEFVLLRNMANVGNNS